MNTSVTLKSLHEPFVIRPFFLPKSPSRQPPICFLLLSIILHFLELYIKEIIVYSIFLSGFLHIAWLFWDPFMLSQVPIFCLFLLLNSVLLCGCITVRLPIHLVIDIWLVSSLGLFQIKLLWAFTLSLLLEKYPGMEWLWVINYSLSVWVGSVVSSTRIHETTADWLLSLQVQ